MKKLIVITALALLPLLALAQPQKIATVNVQAIIDAMPEKAAAEASLQATSSQYQREYESVQQEFGQKYAAYQAISADASTPATIRDRRMREIQDGDKKIQQFVAQADSDLQARERQLMAPIRARISQAIAAVGREGGYTYIIDVSSTPLAYAGPDAIDVTALVKQRLGLGQ